jgi:hypothetical protein
MGIVLTSDLLAAPWRSSELACGTILPGISKQKRPKPNRTRRNFNLAWARDCAHAAALYKFAT